MDVGQTMIAIASETRRTMYETYTSNPESASNTTYVVIVADDGWRAVTVDEIAAIEIKEPAQQEQDEPDTGERPVYWERPHRRLATVNRAGRKTHLRRRSPWLVVPCRA